MLFYNEEVTPPSAYLPASSPLDQTWDGYDAYLFDIDGTLLREPNRVHYLAFVQCLQEVMGRPISLEGITVHGSTDPAILRDAFAAAHISDDEWLHREPAILARLNEIVLSQRECIAIRVMPGVQQTLEHLQSRGIALGVATGNLEQIGWLKVELSGLRHYFTFGGFSDRFPLRADMIAHAAEAARAAAGNSASICVVGDTPSDISAASANGLPTIAVATGIYTVDQLAACRPAFCVPTLEHLLSPAISV